MKQNKLSPEELSPLDLINEIQRLKQELFNEQEKGRKLISALKKLVEEGGGMKTLDKYTLLVDACKRFKYAASKGIWGGRDYDLYFESCRWLLERFPATILFMKESGYHSGGWWKNPDYERCYHLSVSFRSGSEKKALNEILNNLFGEYKSLLWVEPPYSDTGKSLNVWHYRLFCDENWLPIKPRGEVYNTQFTERGWKSFSELNATPNTINTKLDGRRFRFF